jgi:hypothetical protein
MAGQAELDEKNWTGRKYRQNRTDRKGWAEQDCQDRNARTRLPGQDFQDSTVRTALPAHDC